MKRYLIALGLLAVFCWQVLAQNHKIETPSSRSQYSSGSSNSLKESGGIEEAAPLIRVEPDSLHFALPRFAWNTRDFSIYNDGDQPLTVSITDVQTAASPRSKSTTTAFPKFALNGLRKQLRDIPIPSLVQITGAPIPPSASATETIVINDPQGDVPNPGLDVVSVDITESTFFYTFTINFAASPDSGALPILSLDVDQNFGTGSFPVPLGFGIGAFDVGSEFDVIFDVGNFLGDSLGLPASAYVIQGGDTTFTPVGVSLPLGINQNSVEAQFVKAFSPVLVDDNTNAAMVSISLNASFPDLAPDYGHGLLGQENGLSWLTELDSGGFSAIPLQGTIQPGDSMTVQAKLVSVNPEGMYEAEIRITNNSANNPNAVLPVNLAIMGLPSPVIQVTPAAIADTLIENQSAVQYDLTVSNNGNGTLTYFVSDSLTTGQNWLTVPGIPVGQLAGGESEIIPVEVNPEGLAANQSYTGFVQFTSNDASTPLLMIPVEIFIQPETGLQDNPMASRSLMLFHNYPNPFNPSTQIKFDLPQSTGVRLEIYNALGQRIKTLVDGNLTPGRHKYIWNGRNDSGESVASGIYIYRLSAGHSVRSKKMLLMR